MEPSPEPRETTSRFEKLLAALVTERVDFAVVGGLAVIFKAWETGSVRIPHLSLPTSFSSSRIRGGRKTNSTSWPCTKSSTVKAPGKQGINKQSVTRGPSCGDHHRRRLDRSSPCPWPFHNFRFASSLLTPCPLPLAAAFRMPIRQVLPVAGRSFGGLEPPLAGFQRRA